MPTDVLEIANLNNDPSRIFEQIPVSSILNQMCSVFNSPDRGAENPQNPYLILEQFSAQVHIFSYRAVDFHSLFNYLK